MPINVYPCIFDYDNDGENAAIPYKSHVFSGGEHYARFENPEELTAKSFWIDARVSTSDEMMKLMAVASALDSCGVGYLGLFLPYIPGGRQDHPIKGTPSTLQHTKKILCDILKINDILTIDPHSVQTEMAFRYQTGQLHKIEYADFVYWRPPFKYDAVIAPDVGAASRAALFAHTYNIPKVLIAEKHREQETGKILSLKIPGREPLAGIKRAIVVDDICDGGGTFNLLADEMRKMNSGMQVDLYVTHGIFANGTRDLFLRYNNIFTTDSIPSSRLVDEPIRFHTIPLFYNAAKFFATKSK